MIRVIVNADDLGKSPAVNKEIGYAISNGYITSSTILANSLHWDDIHNIVNSNPEASFGVHLNLTEGKALTDCTVFRELGIVDKDNNFTSNIRSQDLSNTKLLDAIYLEWDEQMRKIICDEKITVTHVDGHHHIHTDIRLLEVLIRLLQKWNIKYVRGRYNTIQSNKKVFFRCCLYAFSGKYLYHFLLKLNSIGIHSWLTQAILANVETIYWSKVIKKNLYLVDKFDSYEHFVDQLRVGYKPSNNAVIELMCHPGHERYVEEYHMIKSKRLERYLPNVTLISYRNLNVE